jgi:hypothetical protein
MLQPVLKLLKSTPQQELIKKEPMLLLMHRYLSQAQEAVVLIE